MNMIEKMARAMLAIRVERTDETWQRYRHPESWRLFEEDARAALQAMLEPSERMAETGNDWVITDDSRKVFAAMIRAALEEE